MHAAEARRLIELQRTLETERALRLKAEQSAAGLRSALTKAQARMAQLAADEALRRAELEFGILNWSS